MSNLSIFAAVFLFWTALAASLMQVQLVASPVHKMRVPTYRSMRMHSATIAKVKASVAIVSYN